MRFKCPFTGVELEQSDITFSSSGGFSTFFYPLDINGEKQYLSLCEKFSDSRYNFKLNDRFEEVRPIILYEWLNDGIKDLGGYIIHWNCTNAIGLENQLVIKPIIEELLTSKKYPHTRKQKADNLLLEIFKNQKQDGDRFEIHDNPGVWGNLFFRNFGELVFYIEELAGKKLIYFDQQQSYVRLTFEALEKFERTFDETTSNSFIDPRYDIGLSFAGEDREYVEQVASYLKSNEVKVFYDDYEKSDLWGKDLYQHLNDVYRWKCRYCIVFISESYSKKLWTKHELAAAQARAFKENEEYILPVRFDKTELPGFNPTIGYLDANVLNAEEVADMALSKLKTELSE